MRFCSFPRVETELDAYIIFHMCRSPVFLAYILVAGWVVALINPIPRSLFKVATEWIFFVSLSSLSFVMFFVSFSFFFIAISHVIGREKLNINYVIVPTSFFCQLTANNIAEFLLGGSGATPENILPSLVLICFIAVVLSHLYFWKVHKFVMGTFSEPALPHDYAFRERQAVPSQTVPSGVDERSLASGDFFVIGGKSYPTSKLLHVKAERNYIKISWENGSAFVRARLVDISNQLPSNVGIQIHRSTWVSRAAITKVSDSCQLITTKDNTEHSVARYRKVDVEAWLRSHGVRY